MDRKEFERRSCTGKDRLTEQQAINRGQLLNLMPYSCAFCGEWHVGKSGKFNGVRPDMYRPKRKSGKQKRRRDGKGRASQRSRPGHGRGRPRPGYDD